ncbi:hypothetical protein GCM10009743_07470 [Kribbella swartbergensis]
MPRLGTVTRTGFPGWAGAVLLASGGGGVLRGLVAFDDGFTGTADVVVLLTAGGDGVGDADEGPAAVCCRPSSASLVLNCRYPPVRRSAAPAARAPIVHHDERARPGRRRFACMSGRVLTAGLP